VSPPTYRGRFAPSPTGPLHFGSLVAAVASCLEARRAGGEWLVRIEDLDPPREAAGAADDILRTLERSGFEWDGEPVYQSRRHEAYAEALERLRLGGALYACACTRREIADSSLEGVEGPVYPGTCRDGPLAGRRARAWRVVTGDEPLAFDDAWQGRIERHLGRDYGDFVVRRADGFFAYQLAVVVDDAEQGVTHVVRGADLLESTPRQIHLQRLLALPTPSYAHLPVVVNERGEKLSKQTFAAPLDDRAPGKALWQALAYLGQDPPRDLHGAPPAELWRWARANWQAASVPRTRVLPLHPAGQNSSTHASA
jgi:glutamyl-Q tRNA(Asp) synthetase